MHSRPPGRSARRISALAAAAIVVLGPAASAGASSVRESPSASVGTETVIVQPGSNARAVNRMLVAIGGKREQNLAVISGYVAQIPRSGVARLEAAGARVTVDASIKMSGYEGAGSGVASAVYPAAIGAPTLWSKGDTGQGVNVAIIDTGIDNTGDLSGKVVAGVDLAGGNNYTQDSYGHGTFVAGLIAGSGAASNGAATGVAPGAGLVSIKIAGASGQTDLVQVLLGIQWAIAHRVQDNIRVLNLSLGMNTNEPWYVDPLDAAVEQAWRSGMVVTVAAGNFGPNAGTITAPADDPWVISVGASNDKTTTATADDALASFSSVGPTNTGLANTGLAKPDLVAPGAHLISTAAPGSTVYTDYPGAVTAGSYFKGSGTSFSSAITAGAAALILEQHPNWTPDQVKAAMKATATSIAGNPAGVGAGELNVAAAAALQAPAAPASGLGTSTGTGSLQGARGADCIRAVHSAQCLPDSVVDGASGFSSSSLLNPAAASSAWASSAWASSAWASSAWASSAWASSAWASSAWASSAWASSAWASSAWASSAWASSAWASSAWASSAWASSAWASSAWASSAWASSAWASSAWQDASWYSSSWG